MSLFDRDKSAERLPVALITGFLGSGKTTLLNRVLGDPRMARSLVLVNEFGEVGLDTCSWSGRRYGAAAVRLRLLHHQSDLDHPARHRRRRAACSAAVRPGAARDDGLADPAAVLQLLLNHPMISHDYRLDGVIATVDA
jgi:hypothetical protein